MRQIDTGRLEIRSENGTARAGRSNYLVAITNPATGRPRAIFPIAA